MFNRDIDSLILMKLDDEDLKRIGSDPAYHNVLNNDMFWRQRTINRFASFFENNLQSNTYEETAVGLLERFCQRYSKSWLEYYASLTVFIEHINQNNNLEYFTNSREDLVYFMNLAKVNEEKIKASIRLRTDEWKSIVSEVIVNPNIFPLLFDVKQFDFMFNNRKEYLQYSIEGFNYLLALDDSRIKPYRLLSILLYIFPEKHEDIEQIISLTLNDPRITLEDIEDALSDIGDVRKINYNVMDQYMDFVGTKLSPEENIAFLRRTIEYIRG